MKTKFLTAITLGLALLVGCDESPAPAAKPKAAAVAAPESKPAESAAGKASTEIKEGAQQVVEEVKQGAQQAVDEGKKAVTALAADVSATAEAYVTELTKANGTMAKMTDGLSTSTGLPGLKGSLDKINNYAKQLGEQNPEIVAKIKEQFAASLGPALKGFKEQVERLTKDSKLGALVGDSLKSVKLFE